MDSRSASNLIPYYVAVWWVRLRGGRGKALATRYGKPQVPCCAGIYGSLTRAMLSILPIAEIQGQPAIFKITIKQLINKI
jgi:hypothetical protein